MKNIFFLFLILLSGVLIQSCGSRTDSKEQTAEKPAYGQAKAEVYYFHGDRRCPTCNAIEELAKNFVNDNYKDNPEVKFFVINFDKEENKEIAGKFSVEWSSLFIASGEKKMDLTVEAFQYVKTDPEYLKGEMKKIIDDFLK